MEFSIDTKSGVPFYRQIIEQIKFAIARGDLGPGNQLPTVRQLAVTLSINPNTVVRGYRELEIEGVLDTQQGSGTFVGQEKPKIDRLEKQRMIDQILKRQRVSECRFQGFPWRNSQRQCGLISGSHPSMSYCWWPSSSSAWWST
jgi:GntR family transcriptional regulator